MSEAARVENAAKTHSGFIPSIEGMRALAVLAVLLFHLDVPGFSGGYLGVDLFFVISGFIITRNILGDIGGQRFTLREFYVRRFRRLFPALLVTVLLTLCFALLVVPPVELEKAGESALYAVFSLANIKFWLEAGYFDAAASSKPLLHMWSLSVEEQFYLFWPALLLWLVRTRKQLLVTGCLLAASAVAALFYRDAFPEAVFYLLPFRLHQLMAGALIALAALTLSGRSAAFSSSVGVLGFLVVGVLLGALNSPAVGAILVTLFGSALLLGRDSSIAQWLFSNRMMMWVGQRSYALYLVHWPIVVLWKYYADFELQLHQQVLLLVLSFIAAIALHELVEKPFRKRGEDTTRLQKSAGRVMLVALLLTVTFAAALWRLDGLPSRVDPKIQRMVDSTEEVTAARRQAIRFGVCGLHKSFKFSKYNEQLCSGLHAQKPNVLVIGDSMAADTYMMLSQSYPEIHFAQATAGACPALLAVTHTGGKYPTCQQLNKFRFAELAKKDYDAIVLASVWKPDRVEPLRKTVEYLHGLNKKVLVFGPRAAFRGSVPLLISRQTNIDQINARLDQRAVQRTALLETMRNALGDVELIDIGAIQCAPRCDSVDEGRLLYMDAQHFTPLGAQVVGARLRQSFDFLSFLDSASASQ